MPSGEADYTKKVRVYQSVAPDARVLITGEQASTTMTDEGTESSAAGYTAWQGATVADDAGTKDTGANSLKYTCDSGGKHSAAHRALSSNFVWGNLVQVVIKTYRPTGEFDATGDVIRLIFLKSNSITADGMVYEIPIAADVADSWITHTIAKGDFLSHGSGLSDATTVTAMAFHNLNGKSDPSDHVFLDAHDIYAELGDTVAMRVDSTGHPQVDVLTLPALAAGTNNIGDVDVLSLPSIPAGTNNIGDVDVATLPSLAAGTNAIGSVDIDDIVKTVSWADGKETTSGTKDLVTPGGSEKVQVKYFQLNCNTDDTVVYMHEEDNAGHICAYSNFLDGNIINANLVGCNYITSTNGKKLQMNISQNADVYWVVAYVLV